VALTPDLITQRIKEFGKVVHAHKCLYRQAVKFAFWEGDLRFVVTLSTRYRPSDTGSMAREREMGITLMLKRTLIYCIFPSTLPRELLCAIVLISTREFGRISLSVYRVCRAM